MSDQTQSEQSDIPISVREAARRLGVHENTIRNWQRRGLIGRTIVLPSGIRRFSASDIERMREEMWSQFAPATETPHVARKPTKRGRIVEGDVI